MHGHISAVMRWVAIASGLIATGIAILAIAWALPDFDLSEYRRKDIAFQSANGLLTGSLFLPAEADNAPIVLVVHGDGPQDRFSGDGYLPLMNALLDAGIGVFSWDKPGIGESEGNWLDQSMRDRATEAVAALRAVRNTEDVAVDKIGFLGFSQAGWVLPETADMSPSPAFHILIGGAVNWREQGVYFTRTRLAVEGRSEAEILRLIEEQGERDAFIFGPDSSYERYLKNAETSAPMSRDRFQFVARNINSDALAGLANIEAPFLAVFGAEDLNVDTVRNASTYREILGSKRPENAVVVLPDATHGLLRSSIFNYQLTSQWPIWATGTFVLLGRNAYAPCAIPQITGWIKDVTADN